MSSSLIGTTINQQYLLTDILGEGGMGIVFKAEDLNLNNRLCAIKLLKGHTTDPNEVKRFEAELQIISKLRSPHVVQVLNKGYFEGHRLYIVMELLEGEPLSTLLKREKALKIKRAVQITKGVLAGLSEAHDYGVVHRDLKPANIFITRSRARDEITKVLDFGIAKDTNKDDTTGLTSASMIIGTPKYMAPEQFMKQDTDQRTDLYAVGLLLYQMLSGEPPYLPKSELVPPTLKSMPDEFKVGWLHLNAEPKALSVPHPLWDLCYRMLKKDPSQRPNSAAEVISELSYIIEQMDTGSGPFSTQESITGGGLSPLSSTLPLGSGVVSNYDRPTETRDYQTPPSGPIPVAHHHAGPQRGSGPYPAHAHATHYPSGPVDFDQEQAVGTGKVFSARQIPPQRRSHRGKIIAGIAAVAAIAIYGAMSPRGTRSGGGVCFERIEVSPSGNYMISKRVLNAQKKLGAWTLVGGTGSDGLVPTILARPCQQQWHVKAKRKGYSPTMLTLNHTDNSEVKTHRIKAKSQVLTPASSTPAAPSPVTKKAKRSAAKKSSRGSHTRGRNSSRSSRHTKTRRLSRKARHKTRSSGKSSVNITRSKAPEPVRAPPPSKAAAAQPSSTRSTSESSKEKLIF